MTNYKVHNFEDAHTMSLLHPDTFTVPDNKALHKLAPGDLVKVCIGGERFWVEVKSVNFDGKYINGIIDNALVCSHLHLLFEGDSVKVYFSKIYEIYK